MKMWDGRFSKPTDRLMERFNNSLQFDSTMIEQDIAGSIAWAGALARIGVFTASELKSVIEGLRAILADYTAGKIEFSPADEDVHMAVERLLIERIGDAGAKLHTGRSRNDQVATDFRLYVKKALSSIGHAVDALQRALLDRAVADRQVIMAGYTHLQQAQPILLSHYWLSMLFLMEREKGRLAHAIETADFMPLGAGALAGSGFPVDRRKLAADLGFGAVAPNSIDAVASRDFALEALSAIASLGLHLSRYAEDLIIWSSKEFGFVELDDAWSTGSSMMPQKKNPDSLELIRGKSGRFVGNYVRFATTLKGVGLTYYKDLQEDKEPLFDSAAQMEMVLQVFTQVIATLKLRRERIAGALDPFLLATDLADYLVNKGMPFRQAHKVIGKLVADCIGQSLPFDKLSPERLKTYSPLFGPDVAGVFSWEQAVAHRDLEGGAGPSSVDTQIAAARAMLGA